MYSMVNWEDHSDYSSVLISLFLAYNLVMHSSVIPVNLVIIFKEASLEFFQLAHQD
eukprot:CAMPEP_0170494058 /NCGR_PEP_ID=MMETSP0208-20121228/14421_1 /TAXON_ID=197538 /ORGANISM="Strombidium inclinatum, Strain S3" /LENGTH=55 /DNA_ID=CAMNT_0010770053 /DNA_START=525 /DNA_END=692 /DNA_ORIENTATION=-